MSSEVDVDLERAFVVRAHVRLELELDVELDFGSELEPFEFD